MLFSVFALVTRRVKLSLIASLILILLRTSFALLATATVSSPLRNIAGEVKSQSVGLSHTLANTCLSSASCFILRFSSSFSVHIYTMNAPSRSVGSYFFLTSVKGDCLNPSWNVGEIMVASCVKRLRMVALCSPTRPPPMMSIRLPDMLMLMGRN